MKKVAVKLSLICLGLNAAYMYLIYKCGKIDGESEGLGWVQQKLNDLVDDFQD